MTALQRSTPRLCRNDGLESARRALLDEIDEHLANLKRCIHWLVHSGVPVISVDMRRGRAMPMVTVAPSPLLHSLFKDDSATIGRRQEGALTIFSWAANRHGCAIRWEEVQA